MADAKISELNALTAAADADLFAVVDTSATETKKITRQNLLGSIVISGANVGIGATPSYGLDVFKSANTVARIRNNVATGGTPSATHGEFVIESSGANMGMQFLGTTASDQRILFGDTASSAAGQIRYNHATNYMAFATNVAERVRITSSGAVGIGSSSPTGLLDLVAGNGSGTLNLVSTVNATNAGNKIAFFAASRSNTDEEMAYIKPLLTTNNGGAGNVQSGHLAFGTSGVERVRITSSGETGIGVASPATTLDVNGTITTRASGTEGGQVNFYNPGNASTGLTVDVSAADTGRIWQARPNSLMQIGQIASTGGTVTLHTSTSERMRISSGGNVGISTASPSAKLDVNGGIIGRETITAQGVLSVENAVNYTGSSVFYLRSRLNGGQVLIGTESSGGTLYYPITINGASDYMAFANQTSEAMRITSAGDVGISTAIPSAKLDVHADALGGTAGDTSNIIETYYSNGNGSYLAIKGVRVSSGTNWTTAGTRIEQKTDSTAQGYIQFNGDSGSATTFGYNGVEKMRMKSGGAFGIGINPTATLDVNGTFRLNAGNHPTGTNNIALGNTAGASFTGSTVNSVALGATATRYNTATHNVAVGVGALMGASGASTGGANVAMGTNAGKAITSASSSVLLGYLAAQAITTGTGNVILGASSAGSLVSGNNNVCIGSSVGSALGSGSLNVFLGVNAGDTTTSGSSCIILGNGAAASSATVSNEITLGNSSVAALRCQVTSITALSDMRDKTDITDLDLGLDYINALRPVEFVWAMRDAEDDNPRQGTKEAGFIAQELRSAEDQFDASWLGTVLDANPDRLEASPGKLLPIVIKALQEASAKIDELNTRIATLEGK